MALSGNDLGTVPLPPALPAQRLRGNTAAKGVEVPAHIYRAVADASQRVGVSFAYLMSKAETESSFNANAQARTSSASGLYQFIESTWLDMVKKHGAEYGMGQYAEAITRRSNGSLTVADPALRREILALRKDPQLSAFMAAEYASENREYLAGKLNREVTDTDLYLAHFLGAGGATKFLTALEKNPGQRAAAVLPAAADANQGVFYSRSSGRALTLAQVYDRFDRKFDATPTYYAEGDGGRFNVNGSDASFAVAAADTAPARVRLVSAQAGAIPGADAPFLTSYLLAALEAPGEAEDAMFAPAARRYNAANSVAFAASLYRSNA